MKTLIYIILIMLVSILMASSDSKAYGFIEENLLDVLATVLGGLLAAVSIIIGVISASSDKIKSIADKSESFGRFVIKLGRDMHFLIICLLLSILLPYLRKLNVAIPLDINGVNILTHFQYIISVLEMFVLIISFCIIFEITSVLVLVLKTLVAKKS
jgi:hypothetical protein